MKQHRKFTTYVRRANGKEKAETFRVAFRLAFYESLKRPYFVMVQRGFPDLAIAVGATKREVKQTPILVLFGDRFFSRTFRNWARSIQRRASGAKG